MQIVALGARFAQPCQKEATGHAIRARGTAGSTAGGAGSASSGIIVVLGPLRARAEPVDAGPASSRATGGVNAAATVAATTTATAITAAAAGAVLAIDD